MPIIPLSVALASGRYRRELETLDPAALRRALRDDKMDPAVRAAIARGRKLTAREITRLVRAYDKKLIGHQQDVESRLAERQAEAAQFRAEWAQYLDQEGVRDRAVKIWRTMEDDRVRDAHDAMNGMAIPFDALFPTLDSGMIWGPPEAYNCVLPETRVATSALVAATRRVVDTEAIRLKTAAGHELACTPNHPVLTPSGFVAAGALREGDYVVSSGRREWFPLSGEEMDREHMPPRIEEVFQTLSVMSHSVVAARVPITEHDFHGDGADGDVEVVRADRMLREWVAPALAQPSRKVLLPDSDARLVGATGARGQCALLDWSPSSADCEMGWSDLTEALRAGHLGPLESLGVGSGPDGDAVTQQATADCIAGYAETLRERELGLPCDVALDQIVHVDRHSYHGHVYNLETKEGWYLADGIAVHNCRCWIEVVVLSKPLVLDVFGLVSNVPKRLLRRRAA